MSALTKLLNYEVRMPVAPVLFVLVIMALTLAAVSLGKVLALQYAIEWINHDIARVNDLHLQIIALNRRVAELEALP